MLRIFDAAGEFVGEIVDDDFSPGALIFMIVVVGLFLYATIKTALTFWYVILAWLVGTVVVMVVMTLLIYKVLGVFKVSRPADDCAFIFGCILFVMFAISEFISKDSVFFQGGFLGGIITYIIALFLVACFLLISSAISARISERIIVWNLRKKFEETKFYESLVCFLDKELEAAAKCNYYSPLEKWKITSKKNYYGSLEYTVNYTSIMGKSLSECGIKRLASYESVVMLGTIALERAKLSNKFKRCRMKKETFGNSKSNYVIISLNRKKPADCD